jgi:hypothetical protein
MSKKIAKSKTKNDVEKKVQSESLTEERGKRKPASKKSSSRKDSAPKKTSKIVDKTSNEAKIIENVAPPQDIESDEDIKEESFEVRAPEIIVSKAPLTANGEDVKNKPKKTGDNHLFRADAVKGYIIKVLVDVLSVPIPRGYFILSKEGLGLRHQDNNNTILFDILIPYSDFRKFKYDFPEEKKVISLNLKHIQKNLRNVKKKDSMELFISKDDIGNFGITIRPEGAIKETARFETIHEVYQDELHYQIIDLPEGGYTYPIVISAPEFQKIKRLTTTNKIITIMMQKNNYLCFHGGFEKVSSSDIGFGQLEDDSDNSDEENEKGKGKYKAQFYANILNLLVKLPGLCSQMQIYAPTIPQFPLKIAMNATQGNFSLGKITVYIKDLQQIAYEESMKNEQDIIVVSKTKSKKKAT